MPKTDEREKDNVLFTCKKHGKETYFKIKKLEKMRKMREYVYVFTHQALLQRSLKLYKVAGEVDPSSRSSFSRSLVLVYSSPDPPSSLGWQDLAAALQEKTA